MKVIVETVSRRQVEIPDSWFKSSKSEGYGYSPLDLKNKYAEALVGEKSLLLHPGESYVRAILDPNEDVIAEY